MGPAQATGILVSPPGSRSLEGEDAWGDLMASSSQPAQDLRGPLECDGGPLL